MKCFYIKNTIFCVHTSVFCFTIQDSCLKFSTNWSLNRCLSCKSRLDFIRIKNARFLWFGVHKWISRLYDMAEKSHYSEKIENWQRWFYDFYENFIYFDDKFEAIGNLVSRCDIGNMPVSYICSIYVQYMSISRKLKSSGCRKTALHCLTFMLYQIVQIQQHGIHLLYYLVVFGLWLEFIVFNFWNFNYDLGVFNIIIDFLK